MHIDHVAIWTEELEREKEFFLKYFDCSAGKRYVNPLKRFSSCFITFSGGARIELMKKDEITCIRKGETIGITHLAINVGSREKVDSMTALLETDGFTIKGRPRVTGDGYYESVILDPEGNVIELLGNGL
ncbi:MAG TPA: glyoxalase/bleomycin resistance/extradiol dioxygenase family protein [Bacteroidales bacterium]|nr:glyoxalase/bleomycin resistance/extradiol dioxygenase family protein [Bacteroidales bacterium]